MQEPTVISLIHLGCPKNLIDSEKILGQLASTENYVVAELPEDSDVVLINTCGFIDAARKEAQENLKAVIKLKKQGKIQAVIAVGCLVQLHGEKLLSQFPYLDGIIGFSNYHEIGQQIQQILAKKERAFLSQQAFIPIDDLRLRVTYRNYAYLRVTEGCSNHCTYCNIPRIRGEMRSKPRKQILAEARMLLQDEASELIIIGQDTANYGKDLAGEGDLLDLVEELSTLEKLHWIRLMYMHPAHLQERLFSLFQLPKVVSYLEMPIQHSSSRILKQMGRGATTEEYLRNLISKLREKIPSLVLRSTVMVGFPGETEEEFESLLRFLEEVRFERLGAFAYSPEVETPAHSFPDMPQSVKKQRYEKVMQLQQNIAFAWAKSMVGKELEVVLEENIEKDLWRARSYGEAPEIDPSVYVRCKKAKAGTFCKVQIVDTEDYDLIAKKL